MAGRFSIEAVFKARDKITAPVSRMQNRVGKMTRAMSKGFNRLNRSVKKFTGALKRGAMVGAAAVLSMGVALRSIITPGAEFGRAIGSAAAKFPDKIKRGTQAFKDLEQSARDVGATTEFTATQAAQGLNFLAKAGFNAAFSMKALPKIVDFATASELGLAEAADIASDALGAFGLDSDDLSKKTAGLDRVMDVLSMTANSANADVTELFESVKKSAPIATSAGVSIETYAAALGFLASSGIKASVAGTAAKNITLGLTGIGNKAAVTLKRLGVKLEDNVTGKLRDQLDVLDDLRKALKPLGQRQRLVAIEGIFGKLSLAAATKLLDDAGSGVRTLRSELEKAGGSSKRTAAFIRDDVKGSIDGLISAIESVKISIFSLNEGPLKDAIDGMTLWVRQNEKLIASKIGGFLLNLIENMGGIVTWIKRIGIALAVFFVFNTVLQTFVGVMTLANIVMAANPIGLFVLAVTAAILSIATLIIWFDELKAAYLGLSAPAKALVSFLVGPIVKLIEVASLIMSAWGPVAGFFSDLWGTIKGVIGGIGSAVSRFGEIFGFGGGAEGATPAGPQVVGPQERAARTIEEQRTTNTSEVTIRDETGRAEVTNGKLGNGLVLQSSGAL